MDFVVKKIQELDISRYQAAAYGKLDCVTDGLTDDPVSQTTERVSQSFTNCLKVEPKRIESTPSRLFHSSLNDLPRISPNRNPGRRPQPSPSRPPAKASTTLAMPSAYSPHPELTRPIPGDSADSTPNAAQPRPHYYCLQQRTQGGGMDSVFILTVTAAELVCGERKYKCSGCLRFYDHLGALLCHIEQGWQEGFSCRVFYRKLKTMQEHRPRLSSGPCHRSSVPPPRQPRPRPLTDSKATPPGMRGWMGSTSGCRGFR